MVDIQRFLRESNAIEDVHDEAALQQYTQAWEYLQEEHRLNHDVIQSAHERILAERQPSIAGEYRTVHVQVGTRQPAPPEMVHRLVDELLQWQPADPIEALEWHVAFEQIHPFQDGNGRIGRLIYLWHCVESLGAEPILWRAKDRDGYYALFQSDINESPQEGA